MANKFWWVNEESLKVLNSGYLQKGDTVESRVRHVAKTAASILKRPDLEQGFYDIVANGWMSLSSPIWANFGNDRGLPISCFSSYISDDIVHILDTLKDVGVMTKVGGGTAADFSALRAKGAPISKGGESSGVISFIEPFDSVVGSISQGSTRRGAFAAYLDINHPEILDFIKIKDKGNRMQNINTSVVVDNAFMNGMLNKEPEKLKVWAAVLKSRKEKGIPYIFFKDNVNNNKPQVYKDKGLTIYHSNLCVSGDTKLLTDKGEVPIKDLAGTYANLWNGEDFSRSFVFKTSDAAKLLRVSVENEFGDTHYLNCTEYHRFYDIDGVEYRANELTEGLVLELVNYKGYKTTSRVVKSIVNVEGVHETFCAFEPVRNRITVNGILTGNCSEIKLHTNEDESLVCCLSSMNLELYDEWKDTDAVELAIYFLDAVMQEFIDKSDGVAGLERAHRFAKRQRALGLGVLGWHSYLQKNMIPFESIEAAIRNEEIFKDIYEKSQSATAKLAKEYGEPELLKSYGVRNITTCAIAPTTSSSSILGQVSPGIEPYKSNHYTAALAKGSFERLNKHLVTLLKSKEGVDVNATIMSIMKNLGSVQHLSCLTNEEKAVFRTFAEIDPNSIIEQAAVRQKYIDQGQSLNLHIGNKYTPKDVNELVIKAWKLGIKSLYYQRGESESKTKLSELSCINCEA